MPDLPARLYTAAPEFTIPDLGAHDFVDSIDTTTGVVELTRYDTSERHLERAGMDLFRRKDTNGAAWHLAVSGGTDVVEFESRATTPPREVSALLTAVRGGKRLVVAEKIRTEWDTHLLVDPSGEPVATIHDSQFTRSHPGDELESETWREVEVAHAAATPKSTRKTIHRLLKANDAKEATQSRLDVSAPRRSPAPQRKGLGGLVDAYVQDQLAAIALGDFELRRDYDRVHETRVAIRRLRSTMHVFADVFDAAEADSLSDELAWFAGVLGHLRDVDVAGLWVAKLLEAGDDSTDVTSARQHAEASITATRLAADDALTAAMSGRRYAALVSTLEEWRVEPPYVEGSSQPRKKATRYVATTRRKLHKRLRAATSKRADADDLHRARKVAKRLRYVAELAGPALPKGGKVLRRKGERWQRRLGEMQDLRITAELLAQLGGSAPSSADAFVFGRLCERTRHAWDRSYADFVHKVR